MTLHIYIIYFHDLQMCCFGANTIRAKTLKLWIEWRSTIIKAKEINILLYKQLYIYRGFNLISHLLFLNCLTIYYFPTLNFSTQFGQSHGVSIIGTSTTTHYMVSTLWVATLIIITSACKTHWRREGFLDFVTFFYPSIEILKKKKNVLLFYLLSKLIEQSSEHYINVIMFAFTK